jgi:integrase
MSAGKPYWYPKASATIRTRIVPTHQGFTVVWRENGKRFRVLRADEKEAKWKSDEIIKRLDKGENFSRGLSGEQAAEYLAALAIAKDKGLLSALDEWQTAKRMLPAGTSLVEVVRQWNDSHHGLRSKTIPEIFEEYKLVLVQDGASQRHRYDLNSRLGIFSKAFKIPILSLNGRELMAWLRNIENLRTRWNMFKAISGFVSFAKRERYLPKVFEEFDSLKLKKPPGRPPSCYSPEDYEKVLRKAQESRDARQCVYLILRGMMGLRDAECFRLDASQLVEEHAAIGLGLGKVKSRRRLIPMCPAAKSWLDRYAPKNGLLLPRSSGGSFGEKTREIFKAAEVVKLDNGLRDSFISYRMAQTRNAAEISDEAGNSPQKVHEHYRQIRLPDGRVITKALADQWFSIRP